VPRSPATVIEIATPHVPHNWESHMFFEQQTGTLSAVTCSPARRRPARKEGREKDGTCSSGSSTCSNTLTG